MFNQAHLRTISAGRIHVTAATEAYPCEKPPSTNDSVSLPFDFI
jgi:hypothetical protein